MAFKEVQDLSPDTVISLGGVNKKTGKKNPTSIEGYFVGSREVPDRKKKSGLSYIYVFQTKDGNLGVWGKTDIDRKMAGATPGQMMRLTFSGMRDTPNGEMYTYKVEFDSYNTIEVATLSSAASSEESDQEDSSTSDNDDESDSADDAEAGISDTSAQLAAQEAAEVRRAKVQALLSSKGKKA